MTEPTFIVAVAALIYLGFAHLTPFVPLADMVIQATQMADPVD